MDHNIIPQILDIEWDMFHNVNGDSRVGCQNDRETFVAMRTAQFSAWSVRAVEYYLKDLEAAVSAGRNLVREKYIRMMKSTAPFDYIRLEGSLPPVSPEKEALIGILWSHFSRQTEDMRKKHPYLAQFGRPLYAREETLGWASIETYQISEWMTYSEETLEALLEHLLELKAKGIDLAYLIQENSVTCLGYASMEEANNITTL